jgi:hypothetical protein
MQINLQQADPQADPHDAIAAQLRDLAPRVADDVAHISIAPPASPDSTREPSFHAEPLNDNAGDILGSTRRPGSRRGTLIVMVCAGIAAAAAWHFYGSAAKQQLSEVAPQLLPGALVPSPSPQAEPSNTEAQAAQPQTTPDSSPTHDVSADSGESNIAPSAQPTASIPAQAAPSPEATQSIEAMTQEIASLKQIVEQLQASQQQLSRDIAKINELETRRKLAQAAKPASKPQGRTQRTFAPPSVPARAPAPYPAYPSPQTPSHSQGPAQRDAYIAPAAPAQLPPQPGDTTVPRPPLPLR